MKKLVLSTIFVLITIFGIPFILSNKIASADVLNFDTLYPPLGCVPACYSQTYIATSSVEYGFSFVASTTSITKIELYDTMSAIAQDNGFIAYLNIYNNINRTSSVCTSSPGNLFGVGTGTWPFLFSNCNLTIGNNYYTYIKWVSGGVNSYYTRTNGTIIDRFASTTALRNDAYWYTSPYYDTFFKIWSPDATPLSTSTIVDEVVDNNQSIQIIISAISIILILGLVATRL